MSETTQNTPAEPAQPPVTVNEKTLAGNERSFTQEDITRIATKENDKGKRSAFSSLGIDPSDEAKIASVKAFVASLTPKQSTPDPSNVEAIAKLAAIEKQLFRSEAKSALLAAGMSADFVDDALIIVEAKQKEEGFSVESQAETFKTKYPFWFGKTTEVVQGTSGTGSAPKAGTSSSGDTALDFGTRLGTAVAKKQESKYWN